MFDGLKGNFPIGFLIWETNQHSNKKTPITEIITVELLDKKIQAIGEKIFYNFPNDSLLTDWILARPKTNSTDVVPLKNAVVPATKTKDIRGAKWADNAIAYMYCGGNDMQQCFTANSIFSSGYGVVREAAFCHPR